MLEIIFQDEFLVAINKPHGVLVHPSPIARDASEFAMQLLRDQLGQYVYPIHRLDRKTSGVLLFALNESIHKMMQSQFAERKTNKTYITIVRGFTEDEGEINYPLKRDDGKIQEALTRYKTLQRQEVPIPFGKFQTSRYSLVEVYPETGRMHQIRKHFAHILHPIIGDRPHGCNKQNKLFLEKFKMNTMLLHAAELQFNHPITNVEIKIKADCQAEFNRMLSTLNLN